MVERNGATLGTSLGHISSVRRLGRMLDSTGFCFGKSVDVAKYLPQYISKYVRIGSLIDGIITRLPEGKKTPV